MLIIIYVLIKYFEIFFVICENFNARILGAITRKFEYSRNESNLQVPGCPGARVIDAGITKHIAFLFQLKHIAYL